MRLSVTTLARLKIYSGGCIPPARVHRLPTVPDDASNIKGSCVFDAPLRALDIAGIIRC